MLGLKGIKSLIIITYLKNIEANTSNPCSQSLFIKRGWSNNTGGSNYSLLTINNIIIFYCPWYSVPKGEEIKQIVIRN